MKKTLVLLGVAFAIMAMAATIKVGVVLPMTGGISAFGQLTWEGIELAHEMMPTVAGNEIKLILLDNRSEKTEAANAVARAIDKEKVVAILGEVASSHSLAGGAVAEEKKTPMLSPSSTNPLVTQGKKYVSRVCFIDPFQGGAAAVFAAKKLHAKTAVIFTDIQQDYSVGLTNYFMKAFRKLGGKAMQVFYNTGDQDFTAQISTALAFNPDVIFITGYYPEAALISRQARQLGYKGYIMGGDGLEAPELISIGGKAVEGLYFTTHFHAKAAATPMTKKFVSMYEKKYKEEPSALGALGFDAYMILANAIDRVLKKNPGVLNNLQAFRDALAKEIRNTKGFEGATGKITIDKNGNAIKSVVVDVVKNGKFDFAAIINPDEIPM